MASSLAIIVLVLAIGGVSSKLSPAKVNSLLFNHETEYFAVKINSDQFDPVYIGLLDQNRLSPEQKREAEMLSEERLLGYVISDFTRPVSMDLLFSPNTPTALRRVGRLARMLLVPGSIRQLEEDEEDRKLESSKDPRSTHTLCLLFHQFKMNESKINSIIDYARVSAENLHCLSLANDTGLMLNFDYKGPLGEFQKSIHLVWNPKMNVTYELGMKLKNLRSVEDLTRFVQVKLENPKAKIVEHHQDEIRDPCAPSGAWYYYQKIFSRSLKSCKEREELVVFESELPFSFKTQLFKSKACHSSVGWKEDDLFTTLEVGKGLRLDPSVTFLNLLPPYNILTSESYCSVRMQTKVQRSYPVDAELSLSYETDARPIPVVPPVKVAIPTTVVGQVFAHGLDQLSVTPVYMHFNDITLYFSDHHLFSDPN